MPSRAGSVDSEALLGPHTDRVSTESQINGLQKQRISSAECMTWGSVTEPLRSSRMCR